MHNLEDVTNCKNSEKSEKTKTNCEEKEKNRVEKVKNAWHSTFVPSTSDGKAIEYRQLALGESRIRALRQRSCRDQ